jgi:hypothetical protein
VGLIKKLNRKIKNPEKMQQAGWQMILDNFKMYLEQS